MKYHARMRFRVKDADPDADMVGEIVAVDFDFNEISLRIGDEIQIFDNSEVELIDHDNCDAPVCVAERNRR